MLQQTDRQTTNKHTNKQSNQISTFFLSAIVSLTYLILRTLKYLELKQIYQIKTINFHFLKKKFSFLTQQNIEKYTQTVFIKNKKLHFKKKLVCSLIKSLNQDNTQIRMYQSNQNQIAQFIQHKLKWMSKH
ncbi:hypothetical protein ABPG72_014872 [Tetrahymena utriculariae]